MAYVSQESICKTLITDANKAMRKGDFPQAEELLTEALQRLEEAAGPVHPRTASVLLRLGDFYNLRQRHQEAEQKFLRAMSIYEHTFGSDTLDIAICLQHLAESLEGQQRRSEAEHLRRRSKAILADRLNNFGFQSSRRAS